MLPHDTLRRKRLFFVELVLRLPQFTNSFPRYHFYDKVSMDRHENGQHTGGSVLFFPPTCGACLPNNIKANE